MTDRQAPIKPYTKKEMRRLYADISQPTFWRWLKPIMPELEQTGYLPHNHLFTVKQVEIIFKHLGNPVIESNKH
jgi:hypothetical protein